MAAVPIPFININFNHRHVLIQHSQLSMFLTLYYIGAGFTLNILLSIVYFGSLSTAEPCVMHAEKITSFPKEFSLL